ncbi:MAG: hypothetical protein IPO32_19230 [Crocinitomicaceae bacterium]|nr:hypothetical protein [Crocinitomicaceae bacterium]
MKKTVSIFLFLFVYQFTNAQSLFENDTVFNKKRTIGVSIFDAVAWGGSIGALQFVWYDDFAKSKFHTFDDHNEWQQMDKMGHMVTSWNFAAPAVIFLNGRVSIIALHQSLAQPIVLAT